MKNQHLLLSIHFLINLIICLILGPFHDEAYYLTFTKQLSFGYFDHPPLVAWTLSIGKVLFYEILNLPLNLAIRMPFLLLQTLITWKLIRFFNIKNFLSFFLTISSFVVWQSAFIAIPDSLLLVLTVYYLIYIKDFIENPGKNNLVLKISLIVALGLYAKYHFFLLLLFTFTAHPILLKKKNTYLIIILSLVLFSPHVYWQYINDFVTWKFHLFGRKNNIMGVENFLNLFFAFLGLGGLLISFIPVIQAITKLKDNSFNKLLSLMFLGQIAFFILLCFRNQIEGNWLLTALVPGIFLIFHNDVKINQKLLWVNFALILFIKLIFLPEKSMTYITRLAEIHEWPKIVSFIKDNCEGRPMVTNNYQFAAKTSFYFGQNINALHLKGRKSQYSLNVQELDEDKQYCFISDFRIKGAKRYKSIHDGRIYIDANFNKNKMTKIVENLSKE